MLPLLGAVACKLYSNGNYIRVRSFILSSAPPSTHLLHDGVEDQEVPSGFVPWHFAKYRLTPRMSVDRGGPEVTGRRSKRR